MKMDNLLVKKLILMVFYKIELFFTIYEYSELIVLKLLDIVKTSKYTMLVLIYFITICYCVLYNLYVGLDKLPETLTINMQYLASVLCMIVGLYMAGLVYRTTQDMINKVEQIFLTAMASVLIYIHLMNYDDKLINHSITRDLFYISTAAMVMLYFTLLIKNAGNNARRRYVDSDRKNR
jgi:hypothetical protein